MRYIDPAEARYPDYFGNPRCRGTKKPCMKAVRVPAIFDDYGIRIQYPENWELQQHYTAGRALEIQLVAPSGAFWSLLAFSRKMDADKLMQEILENIQQQYDAAEWSPVVEMMGRFHATGYDTFFFYLDLLVSNRMRWVASGDHILLFTWQAENREFDSMLPVFQAITTSLLTELGVSQRLEFHGPE